MKLKVTKEPDMYNNIYAVSGVTEIVKEVVEYVNKFNTVGYAPECLIDLKIQMILFRVANLVAKDVDSDTNLIVSMPVIKIPASEMSIVDETLTNNIYGTISIGNDSNGNKHIYVTI